MSTMSLLGNEGDVSGEQTTQTSGAEVTKEVSTQSTGNNTQTPNATDWTAIREALPEEIRQDTSMQTITSLEGLAKGYVHAQKALGKDKITVPDKHSTPEDWRALMGKLGVPDSIEDYKLNLPEGVDDNDSAIIDRLKKTAHESGIFPWQLEKIIGEFGAVSKETLDKQTTANESSLQEGVDGLKKEWGQAFDTNVKKANIAFKELLPDESSRASLIEQGFGSNPALIRILANASKMMSEDQFLGHAAGEFITMTPAEAMSKANAIMGDNNHPYRNETHPSHQEAQKEVQNLFKIAYPE